MKKVKVMILIMIGILLLSLSANGVGKTVRDLFAEEQELHKNITWTVEGIYQLSKSKDRRLGITPEEARRLLPVYHGLIDKGIIRVEMPQKGRGPNGPQRPDNIKFGRQPPVGSGIPDGPRMNPPREAEMIELVEFGNREMRRIDSLLTKAQVQFIDNMDFQPEKYGLFTIKRSLEGISSRKRTQLSGMAGSGARPNDKIRRQMAESRKRLIELNRNVLKSLEQIASKTSR